MQLSQLLHPENTHCCVQASSKKRVLEVISELAGPELNLSPQDVFEILLTREKMGSTAIGNGVAFPHGKLTSGSQTMVALFLQLEKPLDFEASDNQPVDLLFALLIPEKQCKIHQEILSSVAQHLSDKNILRRLRSATNDEQLYQILIEKDIVC